MLCLVDGVIDFVVLVDVFDMCLCMLDMFVCGGFVGLVNYDVFVMMICNLVGML